MTQQKLDLQAAHTYFSKACFNQAWDYIEKERLNQSEEDRMLQLSLSSLWHWSQREDVTQINTSIAYWQVSRVFARMRQADNARHYGELCLLAVQNEGVETFYQGYAHEALARAEMVAGNTAEMEKHLAQARQIASTLTDPEEQKQLSEDLATIR